MLQSAGVERKALDSIHAASQFAEPISVEDRGNTTAESNAGLAYAIGYTSGILIYITMLIYGMMVLRGVMEEKTSRIAEVIVSSVKPFQLMMGKNYWHWRRRYYAINYLGCFYNCINRCGAILHLARYHAGNTNLAAKWRRNARQFYGAGQRAGTAHLFHSTYFGHGQLAADNYLLYILFYRRISFLCSIICSSWQRD